jgi:hypothetical protein
MVFIRLKFRSNTSPAALSVKASPNKLGRRRPPGCCWGSRGPSGAMPSGRAAMSNRFLGSFSTVGKRFWKPKPCPFPREAELPSIEHLLQFHTGPSAHANSFDIQELCKILCEVNQRALIRSGNLFRRRRDSPFHPEHHGLRTDAYSSPAASQGPPSPADTVPEKAKRRTPTGIRRV